MSKNIDSQEYKQIVNDVLAYTDSVCRKYGITYYLAYGSLLGAVRHKGFIPWDDDVDIIMDRNNFERFIECMRLENHEYYKLMWLTEQKEYDLPLPKVVDARTELIQTGRKSKVVIGAWVDVLVVDDVPDDPVKQKKVLKKFNFYESCWAWSQYRSVSSKKATTLRSFVKNTLLRVITIPGSRFWAWRLYKMANKYNGKGYKSFASLTFAGGSRKAYKKEWLGSGAKVEFEGSFYNAPQEWDAYLTHAYGDYMTLPPKEKQISNHKFEVKYK